MKPQRSESSAAESLSDGLDPLLLGRGRILLRGLTARDGPAYAAHLLRLSPEDRRTRFHAAAGDAAVLAHAERVDWQHIYVFGAFVRGTLRGVGELVPVADGTAGEIAVSVEAAYRHAGLGRMLVLAGVLAARRLGMATIELVYQPENERMRALVRDLGARVETGPGLRTAVLPIPPAA